MPSVDVLRKIASELEVAFPKLTKDKDIYLSPIVMEVSSRRAYELQIVDGGSDYTSALEGGIRRENFTVIIAILRAFATDSTEQYQRFLKDTTNSIFVIKETIIDTLEGSFLIAADMTTPLLTRPLRVINTPPVRKGREQQGLLIKEVHFLGGMNEVRPPIE